MFKCTARGLFNSIRIECNVSGVSHETQMNGFMYVYCIFTFCLELSFIEQNTRIADEKEKCFIYRNIKTKKKGCSFKNEENVFLYLL